MIPGAWSRSVAAMVGFLSAALGAVVIIGWHAHLTALIQLRPTLAPMQYNTAFCFLLAGAGLIALAWRRALLTQVLGGIAAAIAGLTLFEYLFNANLGIDQLLFRSYITTESSPVGRMSPVTSVCFLQVGLALLLCGFGFGRKWRVAAVGSLGSVIIAISVMAILGYGIGLPGTYGWGQLTRIALHTASGLCVLGMGLFALAWQSPREPGQRTPRWLPVPVALGVIAASLVLWQALESKQNEQLAQTVKDGAQSATDQIKVRTGARILAIQRMARRWEFSGRPSQAAWQAEAGDYVRDFSDLQALEWIDAAHVIRWIMPVEGNEAKVGLDLTLEERRRRAVESALQQHAPVLTGTVTLVRGGLGYILYVPILTGTGPDGFIAAIFKAQSALDRYLPPTVATGESIRLSEDGVTFYERSPSPVPGRREWIVDSRIELPGTVWNVRVWPTPALIEQSDTPLPEIALVVGCFGALVLALTTFLAQRASTEAREITAIHAALVAAQAEVKVLSGLLPICAECKRIRDEEGHWNKMERYVTRRSEAKFSHGMCPQCAANFFKREGWEVPEDLQAELDKGNFDA